MGGRHPHDLGRGAQGHLELIQEKIGFYRERLGKK
jgi:hypothetical protein